MDQDLLSILSSRLEKTVRPGVIAVNKYPWVLPTIVGRVHEELGVDLFIIVSDPYNVEYIDDSLQHTRDFDVDILVDYKYGGSLIRDNIFDTIFMFNKLFKILDNSNVEKVVVDLTGSDGLIATTAMYSSQKILGDKAYYTLIENIPMYGIPAYPGSPRWLHKLYVYGEKLSGIENEVSISYPRLIEWRGSRGIYIAFSKLLNALTPTGYYEAYRDERRYYSKESSTMEIYCHSNISFENKHRLVAVDELRGPDENSSNMLYNAWKIVSETLAYDLGEKDRSNVDRLIMQIQRYVGAADLIIKQISSPNNHYLDWEGEKLHRVVLWLANEKQPVAIVPDTNLFYQGIHMSLLKASIRLGSPWSSLRGVSIYIPKCAETEINGKVAELNVDAGGLQRISYIMALLANRALLETRYYYSAETLNAVAQPCEVAVAVEASSLPENKVLLITADHKAYNAWQTLNVCRGKVTCIYIGHSSEPLDTSSIYGRFYASISLSLLIYVSSLFTPITIHSSRDTVRLSLKSLKGTTAPIISVTKIKIE